MINLHTKILLVIKPMRTQFKFTHRLICTPEYIYTHVFFAHANWTLVSFDSMQCMSCHIRKPTICICKNKGADHTFVFATHLLLISKVSSFWLSSVTVQAGLCRTWSETQIVGFLMMRLIYTVILDTFVESVVVVLATEAKHQVLFIYQGHVLSFARYIFLPYHWVQSFSLELAVSIKVNQVFV